MARFGTYTSLDCPCVAGETLEQQANDPKNKALEDEAFRWLNEAFDKIEGRVRKITNYHDFGSYPSFEIDYPSDIENIDPEYDDECTDEDECRFDKWNDEANKIEDEYNNKFMSN